jgi:6,7-dimethyl-8-ribityllumazine synthase
MARTVEGILDAQGIKVALVVSRFNDVITERLLSGAEDCLERHGCAEDNWTVVRVPGAWEIPLATRKLSQSGKFDAIVALGALVRGDTPHFDYLAAEVSKGLGNIALDSDIPVIYGVLTSDTVEQAMDRAGAKSGNKGWDAALSAIEMVNLFRRMA